MEFDRKLEAALWREVEPVLEMGRPDWDVRHTRATVYWIKILLELEPGDAHILVPAAIVHDIGWSGVPIKNNRSSIANGKDGHMSRGVELARPILEKIGLPGPDIEEILRLVGMHDKVDQISSQAEQLLFEADSLGQIDIERIVSTFESPKERIEFIRNFENKRVPRFKTAAGKAFLADLLPEAKRLYCSGGT